MALDLPSPNTERLARSPLELVVCQIRHEHNPAAADPKRAVGVHDALRVRYEVLEEQNAQDLTLAAGPTGLQAITGDTSRGWKFHDADQSWSLVMMPEFFALETTKYDDWEDFRERLAEAGAAVADALDISLEQRIGLRFIDQIRHPDVSAPQDWRAWIDERLLGPLLHPNVGGAVTAAQQVLRIDDGAGHSMIVRHGLGRDDDTNEWLYIIDHDCFVQRGKAFVVADALAAIDELHTLALQVFQSLIKPELYAYLRDGA